MTADYLTRLATLHYDRERSDVVILFDEPLSDGDHEPMTMLPHQAVEAMASFPELPDQDVLVRLRARYLGPEEIEMFFERREES